MDISQFKKEFMDEALKQSTVMNNSLKHLNSKALTEFSNAAHILKSSSAAMGYKEISKLSKAMEETLNEIINKKIKITPAIRDVLAECVSALAMLIKEVGEGKKESDVSKLVGELKSIIK